MLTLPNLSRYIPRQLSRPEISPNCAAECMKFIEENNNNRKPSIVLSHSLYKPWNFKTCILNLLATIRMVWSENLWKLRWGGRMH
jgi:hypothetical protein